MRVGTTQSPSSIKTWESQTVETQSAPPPSIEAEEIQTQAVPPPISTSSSNTSSSSSVRPSQAEAHYQEKVQAVEWLTDKYKRQEDTPTVLANKTFGHNLVVSDEGEFLGLACRETKTRLYGAQYFAEHNPGTTPWGNNPYSREEKWMIQMGFKEVRGAECDTKWDGKYHKNNSFYKVSGYDVCDPRTRR